MDEREVQSIKSRERQFREKDQEFGIFTVRTKTKWWNLLELYNVTRFLGIRNGSRMIDVGCSDGRLLDYVGQKFSNVDLVGIDFAINPLKTARRKNANFKLSGADVSKFPFKNDVFDYAASIQVIHHLPDRRTRILTLQSIFDSLKSKGKFVLTVLNQTTWSHLVENGKEGQLRNAQDIYVHLYDADELAGDLQEAGFKVVAVKGINQMPVRYLKSLGIVAVVLDIVLTEFFKKFSFQKSAYLLAVCQKK